MRVEEVEGNDVEPLCSSAPRHRPPSRGGMRWFASRAVREHQRRAGLGGLRRGVQHRARALPGDFDGKAHGTGHREGRYSRASAAPCPTPTAARSSSPPSPATSRSPFARSPPLGSRDRPRPWRRPSTRSPTAATRACSWSACAWRPGPPDDRFPFGRASERYFPLAVRGRAPALQRRRGLRDLRGDRPPRDTARGGARARLQVLRRFWASASESSR